MERLTFEGHFCDIAQCREIRGGVHCADGACSQRKVWERLKEYEDAEQNGTLFKTPLKVGDMLWPIYWDKVPKTWNVDRKPERVNEVGSQGFFVSADYSDPEAIDEFHPYEKIGDEWFRSYEEAVAATAVKAAPSYSEYMEGETV